MGGALLLTRPSFAHPSFTLALVRAHHYRTRSPLVRPPLVHARPSWADEASIRSVGDFTAMPTDRPRTAPILSPIMKHPVS